MLALILLDGGVWPTLLLGTAALVLGLRHAMWPRPPLVPLIVGFAAATLCAGGLGAVESLQVLASLEEPPAVLRADLGDALGPAVLALGLAALTAVATGIGGWRARLAEEA